MKLGLQKYHHAKPLCSNMQADFRPLLIEKRGRRQGKIGDSDIIMRVFAYVPTKGANMQFLFHSLPQAPSRRRAQVRSQASPCGRSMVIVALWEMSVFHGNHRSTNATYTLIFHHRRCITSSNDGVVKKHTFLFLRRQGKSLRDGKMWMLNSRITSLCRRDFG